MQIVNDIQDILKQTRQNVARVVNTSLVQAYWLIGKRIIEEDQHGETRAVYGKALLKTLSESLQTQFGTGFSERNLENMRLFYLTYPIHETASRISTEDNEPISQTVSAKLDTAKYETRSQILQTPQFQLTWSHYLILCQKKSDLLVEITLPETNDQIFASRYQTVLPSKEDLRKLLSPIYD